MVGEPSFEEARIARALSWTRAQGALLDALALAMLGLAAGLYSGHPPAGAALGLLAGVALSLRWTRRRGALALERGRPVLGSALQGFLEGQGGALRPQLGRWISSRIGPVWLRGGFARLFLAAALAGVALAAGPARERTLEPAIAQGAPELRVRARIEPPAYTGWPAQELEGAVVRALRGSLVNLEIHSGAPEIAFAEEGAAERMLPVTGGLAKVAIKLEHSRLIRLVAGVSGTQPGSAAKASGAAQPAAVALLQLEAQPDLPPEVALVAPAEDRTVTARPGAFAVRATARDDVAVQALALRWTLAAGSGEQMKFRNGRIATGFKVAGGVAEAEGLLDPKALGMGAGDTLVVWAEAEDGNSLDGPGRARSAARLVRWIVPVVDLRGPGNGARLPPPAILLTERELLARTLRLIGSGLRGERRRARSFELAADQHRLRASFGFFLQNEEGDAQQLDVDDKELAESGDARARRKLAEAVSSMWEAEAALETGSASAAVGPERAAVKALDAAFELVRMALRPEAAPDRPVDQARRLTGDQRKLRPVAHAPPRELHPEGPRLLALARRLLLAAQRPMAPQEARALGDALWAEPESPGFKAAPLAARLYSASDEASRSEAARTAGDTIARYLRPPLLALPPVGPDEGTLIARGAGDGR